MRVLRALVRRGRDIVEIVLLRTTRARRPSRRTGATIVLTGWYGTETVGDQAILGGVLDVLRESHSGPIAIASLDPPVTRDTLLDLAAGDDTRTVSYADARRIVDSGEARCVAMAGGPVMGPIDPLLDLSVIHRRARAMGVPDVFLGSGVGPLGRPLRRRVIAELLRSATCITVRDATSSENVSRLCGREAPVSRDPALIWLARHATEQEAPVARTEGPKRVALALRHWPLHEFGAGMADATHRARLEDELRAFATFATEKGWVLDPVAMGFLDVGGDDRAFLQRLLGRAVATDEFVRSVPSPRWVATSMVNADVVVAMRYHACVFGLALGKAVVAIDYTLGDKIASLGKEFPGRIAVLDPRTLDAGSLIRAVETADVSDRIDLNALADEGRTVMKACLMAAGL